jgi:DNA polymerase I-like protein with 3'-5' exonuclease and polymerase domains
VVIIVIDTETTGLDPRADRLVLVGAQIGEDVLILRHDVDRERIQRILDLDARYCAHNISFDMAFLELAGGYRIPDASRWIDTTVIAHVAGERKPGNTRLAILAANLIELGQLPHDTLAPEAALKAWLTRARRAAKKDCRPRPEKGHAPRDVLEPYLRADIETTRAVAAYYAPRVDRQTDVLALEHACLPAIYAAERRGVPIDVDSGVELRDRTAAMVVDLRARLFELAGRAFNVNSARQIERALLDRGADLSQVPRTTKADLPMFTAQTLELVDDELARALEAYRDEKSLADYVANLYRHTHGDRLFGTFNQAGTETGRMSSSRPNLQNIPKSDLRVRYVICSGHGRVLVGADQDNVELRTLACYAPGGALERAFADGVDLHQQTADACGVDRDIGKRLNYLIIYGGGVPLVARILEIDRDDAKGILDRWYGLYPEVGRLKARLARTVHRRGYLLTIAGRRHHFDQPNHMLLNRLVSGSCADMFKMAIIRLHKQAVPMILFVHDEIVVEVDERDADRVARLLETELGRGMSRPRVSVDHLVAKSSIARRWSDFKQPGYTPWP